jgi:drug/metabolite transporter (DMT)-like permease
MQSIFSTSSRQILLFALMCMIWGSTWIAIRAGIAVVPPLLFAGTRFAAAGAILLAVAGLSGNLSRPSLPEWWRFGIASILMITVCYGLLFWGMTLVNSGTAAVLEMSCTPLALIGFALVFREERFSWRRFSAIGVGVAGLSVLFGPPAWVNSSAAGDQGSMRLLGGAAVVASAIAYGLGSVIARPLFKSFSSVVASGVTTFVGGVLLLVGSIGWEPGAVRALFSHWSIAACLGWLFLVVFGSLIAFTIYMELLKVWGSSRAGSYAFVSPVIAVVLGAAVYHEHVGVFDIVGMMIMLVAAYLAISGENVLRETGPSRP